MMSFHCIFAFALVSLLLPLLLMLALRLYACIKSGGATSSSGRLATAAADGSVCVWQWHGANTTESSIKASLLQSLPVQSQPLYTVPSSADTDITTIAAQCSSCCCCHSSCCCSNCGTCSQQQQQQQQQQQSTAGVTCVAVSLAMNALVMTVGSSSTVQVRSLLDGCLLRVITLHTAADHKRCSSCCSGCSCNHTTAYSNSDSSSSLTVVWVGLAPEPGIIAVYATVNAIATAASAGTHASGRGSKSSSSSSRKHEGVLATYTVNGHLLAQRSVGELLHALCFSEDGSVISK
jgi:hypothetical protein